MSRSPMFEPLFNNEELEDEFHKFWGKYNVDPLLTNDFRSPTKTVTYVDARSVVNTSGAYHKLLKELADLMSTSTDNKRYESAIFKIIDSTMTFQAMMNNVKKVIDYIYNNINEKDKKNKWNIVFYAKDLNI